MTNQYRGSLTRPPFRWAYWPYRVVYGTRLRPYRWVILLVFLFSLVMYVTKLVCELIIRLTTPTWIQLSAVVKATNLPAADNPGMWSSLQTLVHGRPVTVLAQGRYAVGSHVSLWLSGDTITVVRPHDESGFVYGIGIAFGLTLFVALLMVLSDMRATRYAIEYDELFGARRRKAEAWWDQLLDKAKPRSIADVLAHVKARPQRRVWRRVARSAAPHSSGLGIYIAHVYGRRRTVRIGQFEEALAQQDHPQRDMALLVVVAALQYSRVITRATQARNLQPAASVNGQQRC